VAEVSDPVVVEFPLRGDGWMAVTTPAARIPSHGTDLLGQRYAYDFIRVDERPGARFHRAGMLRTNLIGVAAQECYAWGATVHAPVDGAPVTRNDPGHPSPGSFRVRPAQSTLMVKELVVPVAGTVIANRVSPVAPGGMANCTVAVPISSRVGV
jgi:hypothetical protein